MSVLLERNKERQWAGDVWQVACVSRSNVRGLRAPPSLSLSQSPRSTVLRVPGSLESLLHGRSIDNFRSAQREGTEKSALHSLSTLGNGATGANSSTPIMPTAECLPRAGTVLTSVDGITHSSSVVLSHLVSQRWRNISESYHGIVLHKCTIHSVIELYNYITVLCKTQIYT